MVTRNLLISSDPKPPKNGIAVYMVIVSYIQYQSENQNELDNLQENKFTWTIILKRYLWIGYTLRYFAPQKGFKFCGH